MDSPLEPQFTCLFLAHERQLRAYARTMLPTWEAVDNVLQEASVVMWKKLDQLDGADGFLPWARIIVRFEAMRARRDAARDRLVLSDEIVSILAREAAKVPAEQLERERCALRNCLASLKDEHRRLVLAPYVEAGGVTALAEQAGRSPNSLYKVIGRLRAKLRGCIRLSLEEEPV